MPRSSCSARQARDFARAMGHLAKTDRMDALALAHFSGVLASHPDLQRYTVALCVKADTLRSLAIIDKKASTSLAPLSRGWHMPPGCVALQRMEKACSVQVDFFGLKAIVQVSNPLAHLIEQASGLQRRSAGFHEKFIPVYLYGVFP